jgi:hypothetical protein
MRVSISGLIGGLLGLLPFLALSVNLLFEGRGDNDEVIYLFVFGFTAVYAAAVAHRSGQFGFDRRCYSWSA